MVKRLENKPENSLDSIYQGEKSKISRLSSLYKQRIYALITTLGITVSGTLLNQCIKTNCSIENILSSQSTGISVVIPDGDESDIFLLLMFTGMEILK